MQIKIRKGLNIPIAGYPANEVIQDIGMSKYITLDLSYFDTVKYFEILVNENDKVTIGQPLACDKACPERIFLSPGSGTIKAILRGDKRRPLKIIIEAQGNDFFKHDTIDLERQHSPEEIFKYLIKTGMISLIRKRPCNVLASLKHRPHAIFVRFIESAPFMPSARILLEGQWEAAKTGLRLLSQLCNDQLHVIYDKTIDPVLFEGFSNCKCHLAEGPHPVSAFSVHLQHIRPILDPADQVWTLNAQDVVTIGKMAEYGKYHHTKIISLAGDVLPLEKRCYLKVNLGHHIEAILQDVKIEKPHRIVSGDPLMGEQVNIDGFLGMKDHVLCLIEEANKREPLHFVRPGFNKFSATHTYLSGFIHHIKRYFHFTTSQHGEERAFVDSSIYQKLSPLNIPIVELVKAAMTGNFEKAVDLGLLEVSEEDFALPTFICPSKIGMTDIIKQFLRTYASQYIDD